MRVMGLEAMRRHRLTLCQSVEFFAYRESQVGESSTSHYRTVAVRQDTTAGRRTPSLLSPRCSRRALKSMAEALGKSHKERVKFVERPHKVCGKARVFGAVCT